MHSENVCIPDLSTSVCRP